MEPITDIVTVADPGVIGQAWNWLITEFQTNDFFSGAALGGILLGIWQGINSVVPPIWTALKARYVTTVVITSRDPMYKFLVDYISSQVYDKVQHRYMYVTRFGPQVDEDITIHEETYVPEEEAKKYRQIFTPYSGKYLMYLFNKWMLVEVTIKEPNEKSAADIRFNKITVQYLGRSNAARDKLLGEVAALYDASVENKIHIHTPEVSNYGISWEQRNRIHSRSITSVVLTEGTLDKLLADVNWFINNEKWYMERGIPYHRGYMFHGAPGTGKTSSIYALASHLARDIYYMTFSPNIDDEALVSLFGGVPENSILVLEDFDAIFDADRKPKENIKVSFSTLLNAIDGFCSSHGTILMVTTNKPHEFDSALVRPGRVDYRVHMDYCDEYQVRGIYKKFFPDGDDDAFFEALCGYTVSPAELQNFFMNNLSEELVEQNMDEFAEELKEKQRDGLERVLS